MKLSGPPYNPSIPELEIFDTELRNGLFPARFKFLADIFACWCLALTWRGLGRVGDPVRVNGDERGIFRESLRIHLVERVGGGVVIVEIRTVVLN